MTDAAAVRDPTVQLKAAAPTFLVADVTHTARWYAEELGSARQVQSRAGSRSSMRVCSGMASKPFILSPLAKQSYGDWEFVVRDPNGYILVFSELID